MATETDLITSGLAARILGVSQTYVHRLVRLGKLAKAQDTPLGALYDRAEVERLAKERAK